MTFEPIDIGVFANWTLFLLGVLDGVGCVEVPLDGGRQVTQYAAWSKVSGISAQESVATGSLTSLPKERKRDPSKSTGCIWV